MEDVTSLIKYSYLIILMLNFFGFSASIFFGKSTFKPLLIYLSVGLICELFTELIMRDLITINGEVTNAPFGHLYVWTQFISLSYFFYQEQTNSKLRIIVISVFTIFFILACCPYLFLDSNLMTHDPYVSLITMPCVLIFSLIYFIQLLDLRAGYPYINIGIFLVTGSSLINISTGVFYQGVNIDIIHLRNSINLLPLIIMQLLFMYEAYLFFSKRKQQLTA
ncbi:hypothetical protein [Nonlabens dokdonensis]|uniref:hypothetical protein n=1 Tax=Nonlabens dokdonensis TaxID=328515 RepID=UPI0026ED0CDE|nr:hypothetical protein [Nonlabens dokdonensis]